MKTPCKKDCAERSASCHCSCAAYQKYYKANREAAAERRKKIDLQMNFVEERKAVFQYAVRRDRRKRK